MTAKKKDLTSSPREYASIIAKLEAGKSQASIGDIRQVRKLMVSLEAALILSGYKSELLKMRAEARAVAAKQRGKK